jgi:aminomethyltransferase
MPIPSPFHSRTQPRNETQEWRNWAGYFAAGLYETSHEREYYAIRNAAALIDVSPLYKYNLSGSDAVAAANRIFTRDIRRCAVGQVLYTPWCDDDGMVIDDGTVARLAEDRFRLTSAEDNLAWFQDSCYGYDVHISDISEQIATLAVQGPNSRQLLERALDGLDLSALRYHRIQAASCGEIPIEISRTGYTGDLGYEVWVEAQQAGELWDRLWEHGQGLGLLPAGILALDLARIEAGLIMLQVDYISSRKALIPDQKSSPYEIGLGWAVHLDKEFFTGHKALQKEAAKGSKWKLVGLEADWKELEEVYEHYNLAPQLAGRASRSAVPVYVGGKFAGQATSHAFSPILKKYIALATLETEHARPGSYVQMEFTV